MLEKLGARAIAAPFAIPIVLFLVLGTAVSPILMAGMNDIPFAIVTLDEGSSLPISDVNIGDELVERLQNGEGLDALQDSENESETSLGNVSIAWAQLGSEEELREALADNRYYGGIIIPKDFTAQQMMSATGLGGAPTITVLLNDAKNPMLAQQMGPNLKSAMLQAGISVEVEEVNEADIGGGTMAPMMAVQMLVMPLFIMTLVGSVLLSVVTWPRNGAPRRQRIIALVKQLIVGTILSAFIACIALGIELWIARLDLPVEQMFPFLWLACACMMAAITGLCDLALPLGALAGITTFALGMSCAMLAYEMLPPFWQEWVYPWAPQHFMGDGLRAIIYLGAEPFANSLQYWLTLTAIGAAAAFLAILVPAHGPKSPRHVIPAAAEPKTPERPSHALSPAAKRRRLPLFR